MRMLSDVLKEQYGEKIYKLSLSSGCTCPNRDGTVGFGGCTFCSEGGSGEFASQSADIDQQIREAKKRICRKTDARRFIAYFQSFTNTYGDVERLSNLYEKVIRRDDIAILSLGTRPDCLGEDVMQMLRHLNGIKPVWIELGLQTMHARSAERIHRGYPLSVFEEACWRLKDNGIQVIVHVIFGLPGETKEDMLDTVRYLGGEQNLFTGTSAKSTSAVSKASSGTSAESASNASAVYAPSGMSALSASSVTSASPFLSSPPDGIKLQMLNILKGTALAAQYQAAPFPLLSLDEYASLVAESLRILPDDIVIHRLTGDGPGHLLIAPDWIRNKKKVLNTIRQKYAAIKK